MKGKHKIEVRSRRVVFTLELERNITIIKGDSATGKTTLVDMLESYEALGAKSGITVQCDKRCRVLSGIDWEERLQYIKDSIVFVDEGNEFMTSEAFAKAIRSTDNYYVLITRENLYQLPYSVDAVLELKKTTSRFKRTYNRSYPYYNSIPKAVQTLTAADQILTEDSNSGYQMFQHIAGRFGIHCISAQGKSNIFSRLQKESERKTVVIADGAAFGAEMEKVYQLQKRYANQIVLYLPESFEWLILRADILNDPDIEEILGHPYDYIDCEKYFSWEQFFTALLEERTKAYSYMQYSKRNLPVFYLQESNVRKILEVIGKEPET